MLKKPYPIFPRVEEMKYIHWSKVLGYDLRDQEFIMQEFCGRCEGLEFLHVLESLP